ncbi:MAG: ABC transporter substrate-binding protein, partial [Planctomycetes bacterium]|nr:ABC transporter substrate-binding protein [Planctomycetota bacterium]
MSKTKNISAVVLAACCALIISLAVGDNARKDERLPDSSAAQPSKNIPTRIVSLSPSITETLFALGLDDNVVGVTRFCQYPEAAKNKAKVGGFQDLSLEQVAALSPDLVIHLPSHSEYAEKLGKLGINTMQIDTGTVNGIYSTICEIGKRCGREDEAATLLGNLEKQV